MLYLDRRRGMFASALIFSATLGLLAAQPAHCQVSGFGSNFQLNGTLISKTRDASNGNIVTTYGTPTMPVVSADGSTLQLTDSTRNASYLGTPIGGEASSAFYETPQNITSFTASFTYQELISGDSNSEDPADGFAFVLQNDPRGTSAIGDQAEKLGYGSNGTTPQISSSAAVEFNLYNVRPVGTNFYTDGATGGDVGPGLVPYKTTPGVSLDSGDPILIDLSYSNGLLDETLTDTSTNGTYSTSYNTDLASVLGGGTAYVGFTGGDGGGVTNQFVSNFTFTPTAVPEESSLVSLGALTVMGILFLRRRRGNRIA